MVETTKASAISKLAVGAIYIEHGSLDEIRSAIVEHSELIGEELPKETSIKVSELASGSFIVEFPNGVVPYDLVNLISWLNMPPGYKSISDATGWIKSPKTGIKYSLIPDSSNSYGDTLLGHDEKGRSVRVYLPENALCEITSPVPEILFPDENKIISSISFMVTLHDKK